MTNVTFEYGCDVFRLTCEGHAGYAESGKDIVCAGISALCGALESILDTLCEDGRAQNCFCTVSDGYFQAEAMSANGSTDVQTAFETVYSGLCRIETEYALHIHCAREQNREENEYAEI